jgi:hypothetical protein
MEKLRQLNLRANKSKCQFFQDQTEHYCNVIEKQGVLKTQDKIKAVLNTAEPTNTFHFCAFLGLVSYYHRFLPNLSSMAHRLLKLLEKDGIGLCMDERISKGMQSDEAYVTTIHIDQSDQRVIPHLLD